MKKISLIIPGFNEEENLKNLIEEIEKLISQHKNYEFEVLFIDNCSTDNTEHVVENYIAKNDHWQYLRFSRNFGLEASFNAGIHYCRGDAAVFLFSDLQDPPELISEFIKKWEEGNDIVYGIVENREDYNIIKKIGAITIHKLLNKLSGSIIPRNAADFQLLDKKVIDQLQSMKERSRYFRGLVHWSGFTKTGIPYSRKPRQYGVTKFNIKASINYALESLISFSDFPIKLVGMIGLLFTFLSVLGFFAYLLNKIFALWGIFILPEPPLGWTTIILLLFFFGGINFLFLSILGSYISTIFTEVKSRPPFIIDKYVNIEKHQNQ